MACESTPMAWVECCEKAVRVSAAVGWDKIICGRTVTRYHLIFRDEEMFPPHNTRVELQREYVPNLFDNFPEARDIINEWATTSKEISTAERLVEYVENE